MPYEPALFHLWLAYCAGSLASPRMIGQKSIFITGAASGIGMETALLFARHGWFVGLFDMNENGLGSLVEQIGVDRCCMLRLDVTNPDDFENAARLFSGRAHGKLDVLFNCAGVTFNGPFAQVPIPKLQQIIRVNVEGTIIGIRACLDLLRATQGSRVINMSSASAFYGVPEMATYSASKAAIRALTEALNLELEREGITVSDIMPSFVDTPMVTAQSYEVGGVRSLGVRLTAKQVAEVIWEAAHGKKVHWIPQWNIRFFNRLTLFPSLHRWLMKWISGF